jgi:hypothetical protein
MSTPLSFGRDVQGYNAYAPMPSTNISSVTLAANTAASVTVPSNFPVWIASFNYASATSTNAKVYVDFSGATAAVPAGATFAATTSTLNPGQRTVLAGSNISVISAAIADVVIELYPTNY